MVYTKINGDKVDEIMKRFSDYCGVDFTYVFNNCYPHTEINLGTHAIDFREFVELETGYYITDSDWINTGVFTWEKLVEHLNKGVYNTTPWVGDYEGFKVALGRKKDEGILASFKVAEKETLSTPYNPVKNISIEKYYRCAKGSPSQCEQFYSGNGILFMSESDCGKYYYWGDYNSKNELIFFRGEKSWVEANYQKEDSDILKVVATTRKGLDECFKSKRTSPEKGFIYNSDGKCLKTSEDVCEYFNIPIPKSSTLSETGIFEGVETNTALTNTTNTWTDKHYDFTYTLTEEDIESGKIRIDPYFVAYQWKLGEKDNSGALWHCFKNIARFGEKNPVEREIKALHAQIKRLAELNGVTL